jgi:hypothetical protein
VVNVGDDAEIANLGLLRHWPKYKAAGRPSGGLVWRVLSIESPLSLVSPP